MVFQEKMVLNEPTIPNLLTGSANIKWEEQAPAPVATSVHRAVLCNGTIYVGGGACENKDDICRINIYYPDTNKWDDAIDTPHGGFSMTVLLDKLIIVGGIIRVSLKETNKLLTLQGGQWKDYSQMPTARSSATAVSHQSMMIVMGGRLLNKALSTTELLDSTTGQWFVCNDLLQPLAISQSVIVGDMLYTLGGVNADGKDSKAVYAAPLDALSSHQLKWLQLADTPWTGSTAVSLNNKYLLAVGGKALHDTVCVLKRENASLITSTSWESIGSLPNMQSWSSAVSLANQIVVIGGLDEKRIKHKTVTIGTLQ